jgi:hypothetical protein
LEYLVLTGAVIFALFSLLLLFSVFGWQLNLMRREPDPGLQERIDALSRKIEAFSLRDPASPGAGRGFGEERHWGTRK